MKTLQQFKEEAIVFFNEHPEFFKKKRNAVTEEEFMEKVNAQAEFRYQVQKNEMEYWRQYNEAYQKAVALVGKERLDEGIERVKSVTETKTYYFIGNVMLFKAYASDKVIIDFVTDEFRKSFQLMTRTEQLFAEIKNLGYNAELTNMFSYVVDKNRRFWEIMVYDRPDERLSQLVQSYGATLSENILNKEEGAVTIYEVRMPEPDFVCE